MYSKKYIRRTRYFNIVAWICRKVGKLELDPSTGFCLNDPGTSWVLGIGFGIIRRWDKTRSGVSNIPSTICLNKRTRAIKNSNTFPIFLKMIIILYTIIRWSCSSDWDIELWEIINIVKYCTLDLWISYWFAGRKGAGNIPYRERCVKSYVVFRTIGKECDQHLASTWSDVWGNRSARSCQYSRIRSCRSIINLRRNNKA